MCLLSTELNVSTRLVASADRTIKHGNVLNDQVWPLLENTHAVKPGFREVVQSEMNLHNEQMNFLILPPQQPPPPPMLFCCSSTAQYVPRS